MEDIKLTPEEKAAIKALQAVAKIWPKTLWLYSANSTLCVMRKKNGQQVMIPGASGGVDPDYNTGITIKIENGGGDW